MPSRDSFTKPANTINGSDLVNTIFGSQVKNRIPLSIYVLHKALLLRIPKVCYKKVSVSTRSYILNLLLLVRMILDLMTIFLD